MGLEKENIVGDWMDIDDIRKNLFESARKTGSDDIRIVRGPLPQTSGVDHSTTPPSQDPRHEQSLSPQDLRKKVGELSHITTKINEKINEFIVGNHVIVDLIIIALLNEGHILVEGVPGTGKTTIAKTMALITGCNFNRIQGAIDIQPADMLGVRIYDSNKKEFVLKKGPVFTNFLLVDEINRINPKSQSAFIEVMSERQVTLDGITLPMHSPFFVIATQNPHEFEGTFPLIEVQRDRFMFNIRSDYLSSEEELSIIKRAHAGQLDWDTFSHTITPLLAPDLINRYSRIVQQIVIEDPVLHYIRDMIIATRSHPDIELGGSSRASLALVSGCKTLAALNNRTYVIPDDVKNIAHPALAHRIILSRDAEIEGLTRTQVIDEILSKIEVQ